MNYDGFITMTGVNGSHWDLTGPNEGMQGVHMRIKPKKLFDTPVKTLWIKSAFGQKYQGAKPQRRDPVFAVQIHATDIDVWEEIDSQFRMALGKYDEEFTLHYHTKNGTRSLKMRLLEEPTAYETAEYEDRDPHVWGDSTLAISAAASQPYWYGEDYVSQIVTTSSSGTGTVKVKCAGDVPSWPRWTITAPSIVRVPDYSWGQKLYGRALEDATRTYLVPQLFAGEDLVLDSNPDVEMFVAANNNLVGGRARGDGVRYPIARHTPETSVPVTLTGGVVGSVVKVTIPQWFSRPFGVSI